MKYKDKFPKHYAKWRKTDTREYILYDPVYVTFLEYKNTRAEITAGVGPREGDWQQKEMRELLGMKKKNVL